MRNVQATFSSYRGSCLSSIHSLCADRWHGSELEMGITECVGSCHFIWHTAEYRCTQGTRTRVMACINAASFFEVASRFARSDGRAELLYHRRKLPVRRSRQRPFSNSPWIDRIL